MNYHNIHRIMIECDQLREAISIVEMALLLISNEACRLNFPGDGNTHTMEVIPNLITTQGYIEFETNLPGHGLNNFEKVRKLYKDTPLLKNVGDHKWLAFIESKSAVALMAEGRAEEALPLCEGLLARKEFESHYEIFLADTCLCYSILKQYDKAIEKNEEATERIQGRHDADGKQKAMFVTENDSNIHLEANSSH